MAKYKTFLLALLLFAIALIIRIPDLDVFFTADEFLWVGRSRDFLEGLINSSYVCLLPDQDQLAVGPGQGLACTLRTGHPGVITMWTGSVGIVLQWLSQPAEDTRTLLQFVQELPVIVVDKATIAPVRLPTVVLTSIFIAIFYLLLLRLFRPMVALLAALLLALNPFHIALSRVLHHDALSTIFIIISALSALIYFGG